MVHDDRFLYEVTGVWKATEQSSFGLDAVFGTEQGLRAGGGSAEWSGGAAYFRRYFSSGFSLALRGEVFDDRDGARTGTAQRLTEFTLTPEARLTPHMLVRADLRVDRSDDSVFEKRGGTTEAQPTVLLNLLYSF